MRRLTSADHGTAVTLEPGEAVEIGLPQLGGTGYIWEVAEVSGVAIDDDHVESDGQTPTPGGSAMRVWSVRPTGTARAHLRLIRRRPWESGDRADAEFSVTLERARA